MHGAQDGDVRGLKGQMPGNQKEHHDAAAPYVAGLGIDAVKNLWRNVKQSAGHRVCLGHISGNLRPSKVQQLEHRCIRVFESEVLRLDVSMHQAMAVNSIDGKKHHPGDIFHGLHLELSNRLHVVHEVRPQASAHHDVHCISRLKKLVVADDVGMVERSQQPQKFQLLIVRKLGGSCCVSPTHSNNLYAKICAAAVCLASVNLAKGSMADELAKCKECLEGCTF
mmetsp:Transcript_105554/g.251527  ORF Transcript_105554/g.251527 Transcript_105554/m.251527 type:complete len:224 (-) Transcript_105554:198-869(-)